MKLAASYIRVHVVVIKNDLADKVIIDVSLLWWFCVEKKI